MEVLRIENARDLAEAPRVNRVRRVEIIGSEVESLEGLECIEWAETVRIEHNPRLRRLTGLEGLVEVRAEPCDEPWATVDCVEVWRDEHGQLQALPPEIGELTIVGNPRLESMEGLESLSLVQDTFEIRDNERLVSLEGLGALAWIGVSGHRGWWMHPGWDFAVWNGLKVEENPRLESLSALVSYRGGDRLEVRGNAALTEIFPPRAPPDGDPSGGLGALILDDLPGLETLEGFSNWAVLGLELYRLAGVEEIPRFFVPPDPDPLLDRRIDRIVLEGNRSLRSLAGLSHIAMILGQLVIRDNDALTELRGLESLREVGWFIPNLEGIEEGVLIEGNAELRSLDALDPSIHGSVEWINDERRHAIVDNPKLPTCGVERFLEAVYDVPLAELSTWTIEGNGEQPCW